MGRGFLLLFAVAAAGCFSPDVPEGFACGPGSVCPDGQGCFTGVCRYTDPGGDPIDPPISVDPKEPGGTANDCVGAAPACLTGLLGDDFADGALDPNWFALGGGALEENGTLVMHLDGAAGPSGVVSQARYDFRGSSLAVGVAAKPTEGAGSGRVFLMSGGVAVVGMTFSGTQVGIVINGGGGISLGIAGDPSFWRIREAAGTVHWESSTDGVNWTSHVSSGVGQDGLSDVEVEISLVGNGGITDFVLDSVN